MPNLFSLEWRFTRPALCLFGALVVGVGGDLKSLAAEAPASAVVESGFVDLFDGKTLDGWVNVNCRKDTWSVREGLIYCTGQPTGALRTPRQYENFVLELEWRHLKVAGNAGIFLWASPLAAPGVPFLRSIEVQVLDHGYGNTDDHTTHGDVFAIHGASMTPFPPSKGMRSFPTERRSNPSPEWNHYRITCESGTIRLAVNGKEVSGGSACAWRKGFIGLESEGSPVEWRNLRIKELPSTGATPEQSAPVSDDLYDGRTLLGWKEAAGWMAGDWKLEAKGDAEPLWGTRGIGDGEWECEWMWTELPKEGKSPILLRGSDGREIPLPDVPGVKLKGWNRLDFVREGSVVKVRLNREPIGEVAVPAGPVTIGMSPRGVATSFARIRLTKTGK